MYVISTNGVLVFKSIEKKDDSSLVCDEQNLVFMPNCNDCDSKGTLLVDTAQSKNFGVNVEVEGKDTSENSIKRYYFRELKQ